MKPKHCHRRVRHADVLEWLDDLRREHLKKPIDMARAGLGVWRT